MGNLERFKIDLKGLKSEETSFDFGLDDDYFQAIGATEVKGGSLSTTLVVRKTAGVFELTFHTEGMATVTCDVCLDDMSQEVATDNKVVARFGDEFMENGDDIIVPAEEGIIDVSWLIYEFIVLAIPTKHVHEEGECNPAMLEKLEQLSSTQATDDDAEAPIDPRWSELEKLKSTIK